MKIYNTLTGNKEQFVEQVKNKVKIYVCGPTVYNYIHIGNARPYIFFDTVRRYFEYKGYDVTYVQNFTDIDDKIIRTANEQNVTAKDIAEKYIKEALTDADGLNVKRATYHPRVTEEMDEIIEMIQELINKGYAYEINGSVYYDTQKFEGYGKLSKKKQEDLEAGARIAVDEEKQHPMDFVLWKPKKEGEPAWKSPWGEGRPGWHIECSVMAKKYLGDTIDIHAGGEDLVFPHHENEIAQSEAANGKDFAKYWMHNRFLNINNKKMSKSTGNYFTTREVANRYSYDVIRFFMLSAHYRSPVNFSDELMQAAQNGLERIKTCVYNLDFILDSLQDVEVTQNEQTLLEEVNKFKSRFEDAMDDDFNTADAISVIFELVRFANSNINDNSSKEFTTKVKELIINLSEILGLKIEKNEELLDEDIEELIEQRQQARKDRNFAEADRIRDELKEKGIVLEDTREGVRFKRL